MVDDEDLNARNIKVVIIGLGRIGGPAYDTFSQQYPGKVLGVDLETKNIKKYRDSGYNVVRADGTNPDLWSRATGLTQSLKWAVLCLPTHQANISVVRRLREEHTNCRIVSIANYPDEADELRELGVEFVFNVYAEAGRGFANDLKKRFENA